MTALRGAEIIFYPTAIGYTSDQKSADDIAYADSWNLVQRGHAIVNACYIASVNRVGFEPSLESEKGIEFWGSSFVADPLGQIVAEAAEDQEEILVCPVDRTAVEEIRNKIAFPFRDRRVDSYAEITELYLE